MISKIGKWTNDPPPKVIDVFGETWSLDVLDIPVPSKGQDAWMVGENSIVVVDGATPLDPSWPQDVDRFAAAIAESLCAGTLRWPDSPIEDIWRRSILEMREEFGTAGILRSAGAVLLRTAGSNLEFSLLGDLVGAIKTSEGHVEVMTTRLTELDEMARKLGTRSALITNRQKANSTDGYWIFADDVKAAEHLTIATAPLREVSSILLASDGYLYARTKIPHLILQAALTDGLMAPEPSDDKAILTHQDDVTAILLKRIKTAPPIR